MTSRALVAVRAGAEDVALALAGASASLPGEVALDAVQVDPREHLDLDACACGGTQLLAMSPRLCRDAEAADFVTSVEERFVRLAAGGPWAWHLLELEANGPSPWPWVFRCNICGTKNVWSERPPGREGPSCAGCRSNGRYRATVRAVMTSLLGANEALPEVQPRRDLRGLGIGDWSGYADRLDGVFSYTNTHLDAEPFLDLTKEPDPALVGAHDFVIAGDVLEHVTPPVEAAMANLGRLLRPGGVAILTVPFSGWREHVEHFPRLHRWWLEAVSPGEEVLVNRRTDGVTERFESLCFHGPGRSLEMRVFTKSSFVSSLESAGFAEVRIAAEPSARYGILLKDWPGAVTARSCSTP